MAQRTLQQEEKIGLGVAMLLHGALVAVLLQQAVRSDVLTFPERMEVSLVSEVGLESAARDPVPESRMAIAPTLGEDAQAPAETPPAETPPPQQERVQPPPPRPAPTARPSPQPTARATPTPSRDRSRPDRTPAPRATATPAPRTTRAPQTAARSGGSRIGDDFLEGKGSSTRTDETRVPASQIGSSARASIVQAIARQIRPHWNAPSGADAEQLVTILAFELDEQGRLKGRPRVVSQTGINDSNRPQASLHAERAIRAVQLAAPFDLPLEYYNAWRSINGARFDRNLSQ